MKEAYYISYRVKQEDGGQQAGRLLRQRLGLSEGRIRAAKYVPDGILLNGSRVRVTAVVSPGDLLQLKAEDPAPAAEKLKPCGLTLPILYEDRDVIVVNKPAGLVCHPSGGHEWDTAVNALQTLFRQRGTEDRPHLIGRLDRDTSGVLAAAKHRIAAAALQRSRQEGTFRKTYAALAEGSFDQDRGTISTPLKRHRDPASGLERMVPDESGLSAVTHWQVLERLGDRTLLSVEIDTGRMHQIRCHMAAIGHPLAGDRLYGRGRAEEHAMLHCAALTFTGPLTGEICTVTAPLPEEWGIDYFT